MFVVMSTIPRIFVYKPRCTNGDRDCSLHSGTLRNYLVNQVRKQGISEQPGVGAGKNMNLGNYQQFPISMQKGGEE